MAITKFDQFDFLIDIVPRDDLKPPKRQVGELRDASDQEEPKEESFAFRLQFKRKALMARTFLFKNIFRYWQPGAAVNILDWKLRTVRAFSRMFAASYCL